MPELGSDAVVVAASGADSDLHTVPQAALAAARLQVPLLVVHIADPAATGRLSNDTDPVLDRAEALVREHAPAVRVAVAALVGDPVELLVEMSTRARRIYLGSSASGAVGSLMADGTNAGITNGAACPVFLVRGAWTGTRARGARVLAFLAAAAERDVVAFAEQEARILGIGLTILHVAGFGDPWPAAGDVATTRVLQPDPHRAHRAIGSSRNELIVISAADLQAVRDGEGVRALRQRYAGTACLVAVVPDRRD